MPSSIEQGNVHEAHAVGKPERRIPHPTDRRTTLAEITDNGRRLSTAATRDLNRLRFGTAPLKRAELEAITTILERFRREAGDFKLD